jgi:hypothetical protein
MEVRSDRRYSFDIEPDELWAAMVRVEDYRSWWPWLRRFEAESFTAGAQWACVVQPPLPYSLQFTLRLDEVEACRFVTATIGGDIVGDARLDLDASGTGSELRLVSNLAPSNALLRAIAAVARPVVQLGHDWVLDTGLRQFRSAAL